MVVKWAAYLIRVVHRHGDTFTGKVIYIERSWFASIIWGIYQLQLSRTRRDEVRRLVLVSEGVTANDNRVYPSWNGLGNRFQKYGFTEYCAVKNIPYLFANRKWQNENVGSSRVLCHWGISTSA